MEHLPIKNPGIATEIDGPGPYDQKVVCPHCGFDYCHPVAVKVNPAGSQPGSVTVVNKGLVLDRSEEPDGRGVKISLVFECENGHCFTHVLHFHKGITYVTTCVIDISTVHPEKRCNTIWRD